MPPTAPVRTNAGLPRFDYYDSDALSGADASSKLTSVTAEAIENGNGLFPDNDPIQFKVVKVIR